MLTLLKSEFSFSAPRSGTAAGTNAVRSSVAGGGDAKRRQKYIVQPTRTPATAGTTYVAGLTSAGNVGEIDGDSVGARVVGDSVAGLGAALGARLGAWLGERVGVWDGFCVGISEGCKVGA